MKTNDNIGIFSILKYKEHTWREVDQDSAMLLIRISVHILWEMHLR